MDTYRYKPLTSKPKHWISLSDDNQDMINHCLACTKEDCPGGCKDMCELWQPPVVNHGDLIEQVRTYLLQGFTYKEISKRVNVSATKVCSVVKYRLQDVANDFRKQQKEQKKAKEKCSRCRYSTLIYKDRGGGLMICDYLQMTGHRRPCKGGLSCTVMEPRKRGRKKKGAH